jgi:hypothetical protein
MGHWVRECQSKAKNGEAHMTQDEESSLLLMEVRVIEVVVFSPPLLVALTLVSIEGALSESAFEDDGCIESTEIMLQGVRLSQGR